MTKKMGRPATGWKYPEKTMVYLTPEQKQFLTDNFETIASGIRLLIDKAMTKSVSDTAHNLDEDDPWIPLSEAAEIVGMSAANLRKYCATGLWGEKIGRNWFMRRSEVEDAKNTFKEQPNDGLFYG